MNLAAHTLVRHPLYPSYKKFARDTIQRGEEVECIIVIGSKGEGATTFDMFDVIPPEFENQVDDINMSSGDAVYDDISRTLHWWGPINPDEYTTLTFKLYLGEDASFIPILNNAEIFESTFGESIIVGDYVGVSWSSQPPRGSP